MNYKLDHDYAKYYTFPENDTILDLGATVGEFALIYKDKILSSNIQVVNVEPDLDTFKELEKNMTKFLPENHENFNCGVWKENTTLSFNVTDNPWCNMFDIHGHDVSMIAKTVKNVTYPVMSLDSILAYINDKVGLLKADIEGAELDVFMNSAKLFEQVNNLAIAAYHIRNGEETWITLSPYLSNLGYKVIVEQIPYNGFPAYSILYATKEQ